MPHHLFSTSFGTCGLAWNEAGLTGFQLPEATASATEPTLETPPEWIATLIRRVQQHLAGSLHDFTGTALDWSRVTSFQQAVYLQTQAIKPGYKKSYGEVARALALGPEAARAVGVALATNPWPLIVPCHRVVSAGDKMTGFSAPGGVRTKTRLLALEGAELISE